MLKTELRGYQQKAVIKSRPHKGFAILGEQRTGKTLIALAIADERKVVRVIIICPKRAVKFQVWEKEIAKSLDTQTEFIILNFEQVRPRKMELLRWLKKSPGPTMVIVDESHRIKTRGSKATRAVKALGKKTQNRLILGGTAISEGLEDAWSQFDFMDPTIFGKYEQFKRQYIKTVTMKRPGAIRTFEKIVGYQNQEEFSRVLQKYSHRVLLREVQEKPYRVVRRKIMVELEESLKTYKEMEKDLFTVVKGTKIEAHLVITQVMRLQQITGGFISEGEKVWAIGQEKTRALTTLLDKIPEGFIIVVRYLDELRRISRILKKRGVVHSCIHGKGKPPGPEVKNFVLQIQSGLAIDLSAANSFIFYSWDYSMVNFEQVRFRALTYSSKKIKYYFLMAKNTIDEVILESVYKKVDLATLVCDTYRRRIK